MKYDWVNRHRRKFGFYSQKKKRKGNGLCNHKLQKISWIVKLFNFQGKLHASNVRYVVIYMIVVSFWIERERITTNSDQALLPFWCKLKLLVDWR